MSIGPPTLPALLGEENIHVDLAGAIVLARCRTDGNQPTAQRDCAGGVLAGGELVGAIGVSGSPGGDKDDACANAGITTVAAADKLLRLSVGERYNHFALPETQGNPNGLLGCPLLEQTGLI